MAAGVPIVASDLPALREVLRHEENALLARPGDSEPVAAAVRRLLTDRELATRLGRRAGRRGGVSLGRQSARPDRLLRRASGGWTWLGRWRVGDGQAWRAEPRGAMSRPRRVLVVTWELSRTAAGRYSLGLVRGLLERGLAVTVLTDRRASRRPTQPRVIPCLSSPLAPLDRPLPFGWNLAQIWRYAPGHELVHFFSVEPYALAASAGPWPCVITVHGTYGVSPLRMNPVTRTLFARTMRRGGLGGLRQRLHSAAGHRR